MAVRPIGRKEFNTLLPYTGELTSFIGEGAKWFTDNARNVIGIIGRSTSQPVWRYAVLRRSRLGDFRVSHLGEALPDLPITRDECQRAVAAAECEPTSRAYEVVVPRVEPTLVLQEKPWSSLGVVVLILAADVATTGIIVLLVRHWR